LQRRVERWLRTESCKTFEVAAVAGHYHRARHQMLKGLPMSTLRSSLKVLAAAAFSFTSIPAPASAQKPGVAPLLVDVNWLSQHLADRDLVLLHVGGQYASEHIPGARQISEEDVSRPHDHNNMADLMLEMPAIDTLLAKLSGLGISDDSRI